MCGTGSAAYGWGRKTDEPAGKDGKRKAVLRRCGALGAHRATGATTHAAGHAHRVHSAHSLHVLRQGFQRLSSRWLAAVTMVDRYSRSGCRCQAVRRTAAALRRLGGRTKRAQWRRVRGWAHGRQNPLTQKHQCMKLPALRADMASVNGYGAVRAVGERPVWRELAGQVFKRAGRHAENVAPYRIRCHVRPFTKPVPARKGT